MLVNALSGVIQILIISVLYIQSGPDWACLKLQICTQYFAMYICVTFIVPISCYVNDYILVCVCVCVLISLFLHVYVLCTATSSIDLWSFWQPKTFVFLNKLLSLSLYVIGYLFILYLNAPRELEGYRARAYHSYISHISS